MSKVIASLVVAAAVLYAVVLAEAQQARKIQRIGYISGRSGPGPLDEVFKTALRELGYIDGQNIIIESINAVGTTLASTLNITSSSKSGVVDVNTIQIDGALKTLSAPVVTIPLAAIPRCISARSRSGLAGR